MKVSQPVDDEIVVAEFRRLMMEMMISGSTVQAPPQTLLLNRCTSVPHK